MKFLSWLPFIILTLIVIGGLWFFRENVLPARHVRTARAVPLAHAGGQGVSIQQGETLFQAAGWLEADPYSVNATALISGVVTEVSVLEGQWVEKGQLLARLDDFDFRMALAHAEADYRRVESQHMTAEERVIATQQQCVAAQKRIDEVTAELAIAQDELQRLEQARSAVAAASIRQTALLVTSKQAQVFAAQSELKVAEVRVRVVEAEASEHKAHTETAAVRIQQAQKNLERCTILSPMAGIVQHLFAYPGRKQMLGSDNVHSATICSLYAPSSLQVRVDVALADAKGLFIGQDCEMTVESLPGQILLGTLTRITGEADIARNTLQVKVSIKHNDNTTILRPEMLARVRFLGKNTDELPEGTTRRGVWLPAEAVSQHAAGDLVCWVLTEERTHARERHITLGDTQDDWRYVSEGLLPGEEIILQPPSDITEGTRLIVEESK